jgi:hypothetical protein
MLALWAAAVACDMFNTDIRPARNAAEETEAALAEQIANREATELAQKIEATEVQDLANRIATATAEARLTEEAGAGSRAGSYVLDGSFQLGSMYLQGELITFGGNDNYRGAVLTVAANSVQLSVNEDGSVSGNFGADLRATISNNPSEFDCVRHTLEGAGTGTFDFEQGSGTAAFDLAQTFEPAACLSSYPPRVTHTAAFYFQADATLAFCLATAGYVTPKQPCLDAPLAILKKTP